MEKRLLKSKNDYSDIVDNVPRLLPVSLFRNQRGIHMKEVVNRLIKFRDDRNWKQFHTPNNLAKSIAASV